jgi:predicted DCC family thiol-disulfide oxidoreductase YuxK
MNSEFAEKTDIRESAPLQGQVRRPKKNPFPGLLQSKDRESASSFRGWILYDGKCPSCAASARRFDRIFRGRGFLFLPLKTQWVIQRLGLEPSAPPEEMHILTSQGQDIAGADAVIFLARQIWWARPVVAFAQLPGMHKLLDRGYRWIAAHRGCDHIVCNVGKRRFRRRLVSSATGKAPLAGAVWRQRLLEGLPEWIALIALPISVLPLRERIAPWQFMWLMAAAVFLGCKWLTAWRAEARSSEIKASRAFAYFFAWPGMDAEKFLSPNPSRVQREGLKPASFSLITGRAWPTIGKISLGTVLLFSVARFAPRPLLTGWIGMAGMTLILHFGLFHLLADGWRKTGIDIKPIMDAPLRSKSLSEFWRRRWNSAFNRLAFEFVVRPMARLHLRYGAQVALLAAFLISGAIHEMVISLPAGAGYGLPTAYFLLQGIGILLERAFPQIRGRIFTIFITAGPAFWLFHPPFVHSVILPFMKAIGAL